MELLKDFHMPPFTRLIWVSPEAKNIWAPRLEQASRAYSALEWLSVIHGIRRVFIKDFHPENLPQEAEEYARLGLLILPLQRVGSYVGFANCHLPIRPGEPWGYSCVVARDVEDARLFSDANAKTDHLIMGELLGYPECCRDHFHKIWTQGYFDPIWQAAENAVANGVEIIERGERLLHISTYSEINPTLRYIGVRLIPHLPHSLTCEASREMARNWIELGEAEGFREDITLAREILCWPMEWSVLHGIAEVRTPVFKISTGSLPTPEKWTLRLEGSIYPTGAPSGIAFPYQAPKHLRLTERQDFQEFGRR